MLQIHIFILLLTLYSVSDLKLVAAEHNSSEPLPFPLFKNYSDFQNRSSEYNSSIYYYEDMEKKTACVCERNIVVCYKTDGPFAVLDKNSVDNGNPQKYEFDNYFKCIDCLIQGHVIYLVCKPNLQFPIGKYLSTEVYNLRATGRTFLTADKTIVQNFSNSTQSGKTTVYAKTVSTTDSLEFGFSSTIKAETKVKVPLVSEATIGIEFKGQISKTHSTTFSTTVTAPAQTISLSAHKQMTINYALYQTKLLNKGVLNFVIDDHGSAEDTQPFRFRIVRDRIREGRSRVNLYPYEYGPGLELTEKDEWHLRNFPVKEIVQGHELHIIFSPEKEAHGSVEVGPNTHVITMQPRSYKEKK